ncbi:MAG: response regulator transcription factor [Gemmatimonadota bacterium]|nr:response regulator transcription factor [Gemmatimonadota bacterium]
MRRGLIEEGHEVDVEGDAAGGLAAARRGDYDVLVVDIGLPDRDGFAVTAELRADGNAAPVLMLTARAGAADVVHGLNGGADDYLTKPFDFDELVARIRALGRRARAGTASLRVADIAIDPVRHAVTRGGEEVRLTPIEYRLLDVLVRAAGTTVSRATLLKRVWGMTFDPGTTLIDVHVANLRNKLEAGGRPRVIVAVKGVGFRVAVGAP